MKDVWWALKRGWRYEWGPRALWRAAVKFVQRGTRGWSDEDCWSLDDYIDDVMIGALHRLQENLHGCPGELAGMNGENVDEGVKQWRSIILKMIYGFNAHKLLQAMDGWYEWDSLNCCQTPRSKAREQELLRLHDEGMKLFVRWYGHLWD